MTDPHIPDPNRQHPGIFLKKGSECFDRLSMNGKSSFEISFPPFALSHVEGLRDVLLEIC